MHTSLDSESKNIIEQTLRRFLADCYAPTARRDRLAESIVDYRAHWATLAELGVLALPFDEELGGLGGSSVDIADTIRVLAGGLILEPFAETAVMAGGILASGANADRSAEAVATLLDGSRIAVLVGGRSALSDGLKCEKADASLRLSGSVRVVPYAAQVDDWLIAAEDESGSPVIVRVASAEVCAEVDGYRLMDGRPAADIVFEGATIPLDTLWLEGDAARRALERASFDAVNVCSADAVGVMEQLLAVTGEYLRTRVQFGAPLATFQALQHRYADMHMAYSEALAMSRAFATVLAAGNVEELPWLRFAVALVVGKAARLIGHEAIQMHGGIGVTDELTVSHFNARLVVLTSILRNWVPPTIDLPG
jgi:alkylation response protein AidB-like acyl-CoA dehydrogenase